MVMTSATRGNLIAVEFYLEHLSDQGRGANTVITYRRVLESFVRWLEVKDLSAVSPADLERYCYHLRSRRVRPRSVTQYLRTICAFFRWQGRSDLGAVSFSEPAPVDSLPAALTVLRQFCCAVGCRRPSRASGYGGSWMAVWATSWLPWLRPNPIERGVQDEQGRFHRLRGPRGPAFGPG